MTTFILYTTNFTYFCVQNDQQETVSTYKNKDLNLAFKNNKFIVGPRQVELAQMRDTPSPQPEPAEEPMDASQPEPSDSQEPEKDADAEADVTGPEAGSDSEDVE